MTREETLPARLKLSPATSPRRRHIDEVSASPVEILSIRFKHDSIGAIQDPFTDLSPRRVVPAFLLHL